MTWTPPVLVLPPALVYHCTFIPNCELQSSSTLAVLICFDILHPVVSMCKRFKGSLKIAWATLPQTNNVDAMPDETSAILGELRTISNCQLIRQLFGLKHIRKLLF